MFQVRSRLISLTFALLAAVVLAPSAPALADDGFVIDVSKPQRSKYPLAIPLATSGHPKANQIIQEVATFDMNVSGWFRALDPRSFLANLEREGLGVDPTSWKNVGAYGVMKYRSVVSGDRLEIEFRLYEVEKGDRPVLTRTYRGSKKDIRKLTHMWGNEVVKYFTGEDGFFGSKIAFVTNGKNRTKQIRAMDFDGAAVHSITNNRSINILPAWSPDGSRLAFTSYMRDNPDLYLVGAGGGRPKRISQHRGMNTGASWSPDGSKIAVTLSKDGNPEIYILDASTGRPLSRLTNNRYIDTSPRWSPTGREIAFVSDREGGPQIFVMNADGSGQRRVSMNGSYNTTPTWSPRTDERRIAYTTRDESTFDIVTLDLDSGDMVRITQREGVNEEPSFAPNGRVIAFASSRPGGAGVYIANADGTGNAIRVWSGAVTSIDWGPAPKQ